MRPIQFFGTADGFAIRKKPRNEHRMRNYLEGMEIEILYPVDYYFQYFHGKIWFERLKYQRTNQTEQKMRISRWQKEH